MSESVSRFQAEVAAVMEALLKVAVVEITKVFEGRSLDYHGCAVNTQAQIKKHLVSVPDIKAQMENALTDLSDKMVCSVGVQVEESLLLPPPQAFSECSERGAGVEGLCPSESLCKEPLESVALQCMVDLPCSIFKKADNGVGKDSAINAPPWTDNVKKPETIQDKGLEVLGALAECSSCSLVGPEISPFNSVVVSIPTEDLNTDSMGQLDLGLMDVNALPPVETAHIEPPRSSETTAEPDLLSQESSSSDTEMKHAGSSAKKVRFQLSQTPFDCKLLRPCSVQLVNLTLSRRNGSNSKCFSTHKDLRTHQSVHTGRRLCCFTECGNGIWRLQGVLSHGQTHVCKICSKKFKRRKILRRHERFHTGEKPYSCRRCKKRFALRKSLRRHERFHTGERPHNCPHCGKGFRLKNNLKAHLRFHTGEKPFACNQCPKKFRIHKNLEKHRLIHSAPGRVRFVK